MELQSETPGLTRTPQSGSIAPGLKVSIENGSPDRFGFEWNYYSELLPVYEEMFRKWTTPLPPEFWRGKRFLDVGCGMGRNSYWPMRYGAAGGTAIDVDERSLAAARRTLSQFSQVAIERRSGYEIGFENQFDAVFSIGVIQILEHPSRALAEMFRAAKPGGTGLIWVYGRENNGWIVNILSPLRRHILSRLPVGFLHLLSAIPAGCLWLILQARLLSFIEYFRMARSFKFSHLRSIIFDQCLPRVAHYWTRAEVEQLMRGAGFVDVQTSWINQVSWTAIGTKPK